jgi:bacterioferritin
MSEKIKEALNQAIARELTAITQYMWHNVMATGMESLKIKEIFRNISITEMKHAEAFAKRLNYLGGVPTIKPNPIKVGGNLEKMIRDDLELEEGAVEMYNKHIKICIEENDYVTRRIYEEVLADEEEHLHTWNSLLSK